MTVRGVMNVTGRMDCIGAFRDAPRVAIDEVGEVAVPMHEMPDIHRYFVQRLPFADRRV